MFITRMCDINGDWAEIDITSCTMRMDSGPFLMIELVYDLTVFNSSDVSDVFSVS